MITVQSSTPYVVSQVIDQERTNKEFSIFARQIQRLVPFSSLVSTASDGDGYTTVYEVQQSYTAMIGGWKTVVIISR